MPYEAKLPRIGMWKSRSDNGPVASGNCGSIRFVLWHNDKRGNDKAPDYNLTIEAAQKRDPVEDYTNASKGGNTEHEPDPPLAPEDEIPW